MPPRGSISASEINATAVGVVDAMLGSALVSAWVKDLSGVAWSSHSLEHRLYKRYACTACDGCAGMIGYIQSAAASGLTKT